MKHAYVGFQKYFAFKFHGSSYYLFLFDICLEMHTLLAAVPRRARKFELCCWCMDKVQSREKKVAAIRVLRVRACAQVVAKFHRLYA